MTVIAFIIMPAATHSYTIDALKGQAVTKQLRDTVTEIQNKIGARLFDHAMRSNGCVFQREVKAGETQTHVTFVHSEHATLPTPDDLLSEEDKVLLKRRIFALKRNAPRNQATM